MACSNGSTVGQRPDGGGETQSGDFRPARPGPARGARGDTVRCDDLRRCCGSSNRAQTPAVGQVVASGVGAPGRIRTCDRRIRSPVLYPLSYGGGACAVPTRSATTRGTGEPALPDKASRNAGTGGPRVAPRVLGHATVRGPRLAGVPGAPRGEEALRHRSVRGRPPCGRRSAAKNPFAASAAAAAPPALLGARCRPAAVAARTLPCNPGYSAAPQRAAMWATPGGRRRTAQPPHNQPRRRPPRLEAGAAWQGGRHERASTSTR